MDKQYEKEWADDQTSADKAPDSGAPPVHTLKGFAVGSQHGGECKIE